jgi:hypothetical protein
LSSPLILRVVTANPPYGVTARIYKKILPFGAGMQDYKRGGQSSSFISKYGCDARPQGAAPTTAL